MKKNLNIKTIAIIILQFIVIIIGYIASLNAANILKPISKTMLDSIYESGFITLPIALIINGMITGFILLWAGHRSSQKGYFLWMQLFIFSFGIQIFLTQIEVGYFISSFKLLQGNYELYGIVFRGFINLILLTLLTALLTGGFSKKNLKPTAFFVDSNNAIKASAWLAGVYVLLYMLFGYYVAWQSQELRLFYGGPKELNSFFNQMGVNLMTRPEMLVFQYFRGVLWILCLIPIFKGFTGSRIELVIFSGIAMALLPTIGLAFPNPLMPPTIRLYHFIETSISTGIFGVMCALFIPKRVESVNN